jgi:hypothetical protein
MGLVIFDATHIRESEFDKNQSGSGAHPAWGRAAYGAIDYET